MTAEAFDVAIDDGYPVHPAATVFPMLDADELDELADDILANGLISPLMLDAAGEMLVDGRNRREACRIAGVKPVYERLPDGVEPVDYIASVNVARRHLTKGQRTMALAMLYPNPEKGGRGKHSQIHESLDESKRVFQNRLSQARLILRVAEDLARQVMAGSKHFDAALTEARERQQAELGQEAQMRRLHQEAPDLVSLVLEERLTLAGATAEADERQRLRQHTIDQSHRALAAVVTNLAANVDAILGGLELGEPLRFDQQQADIIRKSIKLLETRRLLK